MADERHDVAFVVGALLGGVAGAVYTLFNAPQAGADTRAQLAEQFGAATSRVDAAATRLGAEGGRLIEQASATVATLTERVGRDESSGAGETITEPVLLLPDPLEPDPVVLDPTRDAAIDDIAVGNPTVGGLPAGDDLDLVIDGPRPASSDR